MCTWNKVMRARRLLFGNIFILQNSDVSVDTLEQFFIVSATKIIRIKKKTRIKFRCATRFAYIIGRYRQFELVMPHTSAFITDLHLTLESHEESCQQAELPDKLALYVITRHSRYVSRETPCTCAKSRDKIALTIVCKSVLLRNTVAFQGRNHLYTHAYLTRSNFVMSNWIRNARITVIVLMSVALRAHCNIVRQPHTRIFFIFYSTDMISTCQILR